MTPEARRQSEDHPGRLHRLTLVFLAWWEGNPRAAIGSCPYLATR